MGSINELQRRAKCMDVSVNELKRLDKEYKKYGDPAIYFISGTVLTSKGRMLPYDYYINVANGYDVKLISPHINGTNKRIKVPKDDEQARKFANSYLRRVASNSDVDNKDGKWNKLLHPRVPKGTSKGGQFTSNGSICSLEHFNSLSLEEKKAMIQEIMTSYNSFSRRKLNKGIKNSVTQRFTLGFGMTKPPKSVINDIDEFNRLLESGDYIPLFRTVTTNENMTCNEMARRFMYDDEVPMNYGGGTTEGDGFYFTDVLDGSTWYAGRVAKGERGDVASFTICALIPKNNSIYRKLSKYTLMDTQEKFEHIVDIDFVKHGEFKELAEMILKKIHEYGIDKDMDEEITLDKMFEHIGYLGQLYNFEMCFAWRSTALSKYSRLKYYKDYGLFYLADIYLKYIESHLPKDYDPQTLPPEDEDGITLGDVSSRLLEIIAYDIDNIAKRVSAETKDNIRRAYMKATKTSKDVLGIDRHRNLYLKKQGIDESINTLRGMSPFFLLQGYKGHYSDRGDQTYYMLYDRQPLICFSGNLFDENIREKLKFSRESLKLHKNQK